MRISAMLILTGTGRRFWPGLYPTYLDLDEAEAMVAFIRSHRSRQKQKLVRQLPLSCLLAESHRPVLGPEPIQRNEPANITLVIRAIASIKAIPEETVRDAIAQNTRQLYGRLW